jgi:hypothetical protein
MSELEKIDPETKISVIADKLNADLVRLRDLLKENPNIRVSDILFPSFSSREKNVRDTLFSIFHRAAKSLGRNSEDAIIADSTVLIKNKLSDFDLTELQTQRGRYASDPFIWVNKEVAPLLDPDMHELIAPKKNTKGKWFIHIAKPYLAIKKGLYDRLN